MGAEQPQPGGDQLPGVPNWRDDENLAQAVKELRSPVYERRLMAARRLAAALEMPMKVSTSELPETLDDDMEITMIDGHHWLMIYPPAEK